jgi:phosphoribosylformylglycinamidine cyclo-ligase
LYRYVAVSKSFNIHAQVVGRVEDIEGGGKSKVTVKSEYGEFSYDSP